MLTRRTLLATSAAGLAAPSLIGAAEAATPKTTLVQAKAIDDIVGAFDPAQSYEFSNNEICGNIYRKLIAPDPKDGTKLIGDLAEKWDVSKDGLTFTFHLRNGVLFESGKPVTAEDAAFSLQRVVKLNLTPGFVLTQFGWTKDNVDKMITATGPSTLQIVLPAVQSTSFVLNCLSATCGSIVEKAVVMAHQDKDDLGNAWLRTHSTATGPYKLVEWTASDHVIIDANPHAAVKPRLPRVVIRHVAEPAAQLLMLQKADADIARDLSSDQIKSIAGNKDFSLAKAPQLAQLYVAMNMSLPQLSKVPVLQALKYAVDYDAIAKNITPNTWGVWQSFLPEGVFGVINDRPFKKDVAKAKALLAQGGYPNGFEVTMDHFASAPYSTIAQALQADFAAIGVKVQLLAGERKQVTTKMRARQFQLTLMSWFPDYLDPNSNAQAFCYNADDSENAKVKIPAWRAHYFDKAQTEAVDTAAKELSDAKRLAIYAKMQRDFMQSAPFLFLLQQNEVDVERKGVSGIQIGALPDYTHYAAIMKA